MSATRVLLTAFGPFDGRAVNGSATLLRAIAAAHPPGIELRTLVLPVVWGAVEGTALPVLAAWDPQVILGLGEGGPGRIAIETTARNCRERPDTTGHPPPTPVIDPAGPDVACARLALPPDLWRPAPPRIVTSDDAGTFLCNNALFRYARSRASRAGFLHLPPQGDIDDATYIAPLLGPVLAVLAANVDGPDPASAG